MTLDVNAMVEAGAVAAFEAYVQFGADNRRRIWNDAVDEDVRDAWRGHARAALAAALPMLVEAMALASCTRHAQGQDDDCPRRRAIRDEGARILAALKEQKEGR